MTWANVYSRAYQPPAGQGVLNAGKALGMTSSFGEVLQSIMMAQLEAAE